MLRPVLAIVLLSASCALAQLTGRLVSPEGALEGVGVSAREEGAPVTGSVVSSAGAGPQARPIARYPRPDFGPDADKQAAFLATVNRGPEARPYTLQALPRVKGAGRRVVITEYELPRRPLMPHDVIVDEQGIVW